MIKLLAILLSTVLLSACNNEKLRKPKVSARDSLQQKLNAATDYEAYLHGPVKEVTEEFEKLYKENPYQACMDYQLKDAEELLVYREALENVSIDNDCVEELLRTIDGYYTYRFYNAWVDYKKRTPIENKVVILDKAYSLPGGNPLPAKTINLTFDDGPHITNTEKVLGTLLDLNIKANFFVVGRNVKKYPEILKKTAEYGNSIGGHSMTHANLPKIGFEAAKKEILGIFDEIEKVLGGVDPFFRFPYGARTKPLREFLAQNNISDFFWTVDTLDWKYKDPDFLLKYALEQTRKSGRGIVLFHDVQPQTAAILPLYIDALAKENYKTVVYEPK